MVAAGPPCGIRRPIEVEVRGPRDAAAQAAEVQRGSADFTIVSHHLGPLLPRERLRALAVSSPGRLHGFTEPILNHMFLNVRRPPFDDVRARRALNYATDRARIVELDGGREVSSPTCQVIPSGFPGHEPYFPYTAQPGPGRPWSAPDMERARRLVAASGTRGERVVVTVPDFQRGVGRYFAKLLRRLGYRASLRVMDVRYWDAVHEPRTRVQIGFYPWGADYVSASTFIDPLFGCIDYLSRFCDPALMRQVERARAARGAVAAERWAAVDRRVTDLAPAVPLTNRRSIELVSSRVGNVQNHIWGVTLLEQMWVR